MKKGVLVGELVAHIDERVFFREIVCVSDDSLEEGFGKWSCSFMYPDVIKAWHIREIQVDGCDGLKGPAIK